MWADSSSTSSRSGAHLEQLQHLRVGGRLVEGDPAQRQRLGGVGAERGVDDRAVMGAADPQRLRLATALDLDLLLDDLQRAPLVLEQVAVALDRLHEQVLDVGHHVGEGPGEVVVLAHVDAGQAGHRRPAGEALAAMQGGLVPDARHARRQVRVPGQQRPAGGAARSRDRPVVGAARLDGEADRTANGVDLGGDRGPVAAEGLLEDGRVGGRVGRVEAGGQLRPQLADHVGAQQLALPVGGEAEGQQLAQHEDVGGAPGIEAQPQQPVLERRRPVGGGGVDAGAVALQQGPEGGRRGPPPRAAQSGAVPASASAGRRAGPRDRRTRPACRRRRGGRSPSARADPGRARSPARRAGRRRWRPRCGGRPSGRGGSAPGPRVRPAPALRARAAAAAAAAGAREAPPSRRPAPPRHRPRSGPGAASAWRQRGAPGVV